jgi:uncharacterized membrane protein (UPF0127 family)
MRTQALRRGEEVVCARCQVAASPWARMRGLLGRAALASDEGMLFVPGSSVHTLFMRFPIDVVFLDKELKVLRVAAAVPAWRARSAHRAKRVLELPAGASARLGLQAGDQLTLAETG